MSESIQGQGIKKDPRLFLTVLSDGTKLPFPFPRLLDTSEVATFLNVESRTVIEWIEGGTLRSFRLPGGHEGRPTSYRIPADALLESIGGNYDVTETLISCSMKETKITNAESNLKLH